MKTKERLILNLVLFVGLVAFLALLYIQKTRAEQSGGSPDSGVTSRLKSTYDAIVGMGQGSDSSGSWGDWGAYWNRTRSAVVDYSKQDLQDYDDMRGYNWSEYTPNGSSEDTTDEEAAWTNTAGDADTGVWKDTRTGLYWSVNQGCHNNLFTRASCPFFSATPRGSYTGTDTNCGPTEAAEGVTVSAINTCAQLSLESVTGGGAKTDWYLPSQKALMQAYLDGIFNKTGPTFTTYEYFWSSTENSGLPDFAWYVYLSYGYTYLGDKSIEGSSSVRCVRRD